MKVDLEKASRAELIKLIKELLHRQEELQKRVEELEAENEQLRRQVGAKAVPTFVKANRVKPEPKPRKKRAGGYGRVKDRVTRRVHHAYERCPECGEPLSGGRVVWRRQVIELPAVKVEHVEHVVVARRCERCQKAWAPEQEVRSLVLGQQRVGVSVQAEVALLREECRLPFRVVQQYLNRRWGLSLSVGAIVRVVQRVAERGREEYEQLNEQIRASPVVNGDETGWREEGQNGYLWSFSTPTQRYFLYRRTRSGTVVEEVLGEKFLGVLVSDFYAGYSVHLGRHQRCWVHLLRDIHELRQKHPDDESLKKWAEAVRAIYDEAKAWAGPPTNWTAEHQQQERQRRQHEFERRLSALCREHVKTNELMSTLCQRVEKFLPELFVFVADERVPSDNNAAERSLRPVVVSRKISGGTRSDTGSKTKTILASLFGTWRLQGRDLYHSCLQLLTS